MRTSTSSNDLTTIQITKNTLRKVRAHCRKNRFIQRYWVADVLEQATKGKGAANRNRSLTYKQ